MGNESQSAPSTNSTAQLGITKVTANFIMTGMFVVWAYLSVRNDMLFPVTDNFMWIFAILSSGNAVSVIKGVLKK